MIYFIADTHFDHTNIIKYCNRPFANIDRMNKALITNWNKTIKPTDTVFFLGDWAFGKGHRPVNYWLKQLNGNIITIKGSHDLGLKARNSQVLNCGYLRFLLIHDPEQIPRDWKGWVIHGHKHNNETNYPFIDGNKKTINVSVEVIGYKPLSLNKLLSLNIDSVARMETVNSKIIKKEKHMPTAYKKYTMPKRQTNIPCLVQIGTSR